MLGRLIGKPRYAREFTLVSPDSDAFRRGDYGLPLIESVRSARRVGPDKEVTFDTAAEIVQTRHVPLPDGHRSPFSAARR